MEEDKPVPKGWKSSPAEERVEEDNLPTGRVTGGPSHHPGERAPPEQINTRACDLKSQEQTVPKGWKQSEDESIDNQDIRTSNRAELWIVNLDSSNGSSKVPGDRNLGWQDENSSMNKT